MKVVFQAQLVYLSQMDFTSNDGSKVELDVLHLVDTDAFLERDRIFTINVKRGLSTGLEMGSYVKVAGILTRDKGELKIRPESVVGVNADPALTEKKK